MVVINNGKGTRLNHNGSLSHLDIAFCSRNLSYNMDFDILDDLWGSDHFPLLVKYSLDISKYSNCANKYIYSKADWDLFQKCLQEDQSLLSQIRDVDTAYNILISSLINARNRSVPVKGKKLNHKYSPYWTAQCSSAKQIKKLAEKELRKTKTLENQINFKKCKANFRRTLANAKLNYWNNFCSGLKHQANLKHVWEIINKLKGKKSKSTFFFKNEKNEVVEDGKLSEIFADNFISLSANKNLSTEIIKDRANTIKEFLNSHDRKSNQNIFEIDSKLINETFKMIELTSVIKNVNINSSPGCDNIPFSLFTHAPEIVINFVLELINLSWCSNKIPAPWKTSIVNPILKQGKNAKDINSYRPISITTTISKLIEKMIVKRLTWYLGKNKLLNPDQAGFRRNFCTADPIIRLNYESEFAVSSGNYTIAVLIDFTRAFDLIWIDGLIAKMLNLGITGKMINWIKNFLTNRINRVKIGSNFSADYILENGTPQGSSLSPLLFLIMVNDFPILSLHTSKAFFADDCTLWRSGNNIRQIIHHLQEDLDSIVNWCNKWGLVINTDKTTGIIFSRNQVNLNTIILKLNNKNIGFKNQCKLLGVVFDNHLTWKPHIDYLVEKSTKSLNILRCLSGTRWGQTKPLY